MNHKIQSSYINKIYSICIRFLNVFGVNFFIRVNAKLCTFFQKQLKHMDDIIRHHEDWLISAENSSSKDVVITF